MKKNLGIWGFLSPFVKSQTGRIMRLTFLFLLAGLLQVSASSFGQNSKLSLELQNVAVREVMQAIETQSKYRFAYSSEFIDLDRKVDLSLKDQSIDQTLKALFEGPGITYEVLDRLVMLYGKTDRLNAQQQRTVTGKVTESSGEPLPGVTVLIKGTTQGTITDFDGNYTISNVPTAGTLVFSFVGMRSQEVVVGNQSTINVMMEEDAIGIDEVVAVGYGTQKKANLTGAITAVKTDELNTISTTNLSNALAGRAPGVNITGASGLTGATSDIRIRGSFGEPLYVIDGIARSKSAFDNLDMKEVDQLSFLKDAATASIYGSRAGNGVVLVTTRQGTKQKPQLSFQSSYSTSSPTMELFSDKITAADELTYQNRVAEFNGLNPPNGSEEFAYFENGGYNVNDFIWRNPTSQKYSLGVSGGNEKLTYYSLVSYRGEKGAYKSLSEGQVNIRSNITANITDKIKLNLNISANQNNHDRFFWPYSADDDDAVADLYRATFNWPKLYPFYTLADGTPTDYVTEYAVQTPMGGWNAWGVIDQVIGDRYIKTRNRELNTILSLDIDLGDFVPGLSTKVKGNYIGGDYNRKRYMTHQTNYQFISADPDGNRFIPGPPDPNKTGTFTFRSSKPFLSYDLATTWAYQFNWFLNYKRTFNKHAVDGMVVWEQSENGSTNAFAEMQDPITSYDQSFVYSNDSQNRYGNGWEIIGARQSLIGRLNYNFDEKYIAEFSFRYDGNTLFPKEKRWGFFPSVSAAWRISQESFMEDSRSWLDDLKLRMSYGTTGNDLDVNNRRIGAFSYVNTYTNAGSYLFGDGLNKAIKPGATPNPNLTWATSTTYNTGLDFTTLNGRLYSTLDIFYKKEDNILGSRLVTLPYEYGQNLAPENYAERSWRGGEFTIGWRDDAKGGDIKYSVYANLGYAKDQWDKLDESEAFQPGGSREWQSAIGQPLNRLYGYKSLGIVNTQEQLDKLLATGLKQFGRDPYLGGLYFEDIRGDGYSPGPDGKIDGNDIQLLTNNYSPRINYGFGGDISWKGIVIAAHFQGVGAYDRILSIKGNTPGLPQYGGTARPYYPIWADDVWTPENPDAKYPRPIGKSWQESGTGASSHWIRNGAYVRLKSLDIGYNIPKSLLSKVNVQDAKLFFNGTNLFAISPMKEFHDPEQKNYDSFPIMKTFTFGLELKF